MHLSTDQVAPAPVYQSIWKQARLEDLASAGVVPVVRMLTDSSLTFAVEAQHLEEGFKVMAHSSPHDVAVRDNPSQPVCAVIDLDMYRSDICSLISNMPGKSRLPIILLGQCEDTRAIVRAMKLGAFDFLPKPVDIKELIRAVSSAVYEDRRQAPKRLEELALRVRVASLTPREREVLPLVVGGLLNKQAASLLGISEITLQIHRGQVMRKMQASSLAELVRMCMKLHIRHWSPTV